MFELVKYIDRFTIDYRRCLSETRWPKKYRMVIYHCNGKHVEYGDTMEEVCDTMSEYIDYNYIDHRVGL